MRTEYICIRSVSRLSISLPPCLPSAAPQRAPRCSRPACARKSPGGRARRTTTKYKTSCIIQCVLNTSAYVVLVVCRSPFLPASRARPRSGPLGVHGLRARESLRQVARGERVGPAHRYHPRTQESHGWLTQLSNAFCSRLHTNRYEPYKPPLTP